MQLLCWSIGYIQALQMAPKILDGLALSKALRSSLLSRIEGLCTGSETQYQNSFIPHLAILLVGKNEASEIYVEQKRKTCQMLGIECSLLRLPGSVRADAVLREIDRVNANTEIHGLIVQLPLPEAIQQNEEEVQTILTRVSPEKDVDGFHPNNIGNILLGRQHLAFKPATPYGIELLLNHYEIPTRGKHAVIIGKSLIVGQPLMSLLSLEKGLGATVTACDRNTDPKTLRCLLETSDILIVATGKHHLIDRELARHLKHGVVIIDVGIHRVLDSTKSRGYRLEGDVDASAVADKAAFITPVPGGVGPMTVISLLMNTVEAAVRQRKAQAHLPNN